MPSVGKGDGEAEDLKIPVSPFVWDEQMAGRVASLHTTVLWPELFGFIHISHSTLTHSTLRRLIISQTAAVWLVCG